MQRQMPMPMQNHFERRLHGTGVLDPNLLYNQSNLNMIECQRNNTSLSPSDTNFSNYSKNNPNQNPYINKVEINTYYKNNIPQQIKNNINNNNKIIEPDLLQIEKLNINEAWKNSDSRHLQDNKNAANLISLHLNQDDDQSIY